MTFNRRIRVSWIVTSAMVLAAILSRPVAAQELPDLMENVLPVAAPEAHREPGGIELLPVVPMEMPNKTPSEIAVRREREYKHDDGTFEAWRNVIHQYHSFVQSFRVVTPGQLRRVRFGIGNQGQQEWSFSVKVRVFNSDGIVAYWRTQTYTFEGYDLFWVSSIPDKKIELDRGVYHVGIEIRHSPIRMFVDTSTRNVPTWEFIWVNESWQELARGENPFFIRMTVDEKESGGDDPPPPPPGLTVNGHSVAVQWNSRDRFGDAIEVYKSGNSAALAFYDKSSMELLVRVLNGCSFNGHWWVSVAPVTDLGFSITITNPRGQQWRFANALGTPALSRDDRTAFACQ